MARRLPAFFRCASCWLPLILLRGQYMRLHSYGRYMYSRYLASGGIVVTVVIPVELSVRRRHNSRRRINKQAGTCS
ncbi:hypothetical protein IWZ00DRAFT_495290 [Phyllosticta capitalensis]